MYNPKTGDPIFLNSKVLPFNVNLNSLNTVADVNNVTLQQGNANYASSPTSDVLGGINK